MKKKISSRGESDKTEERPDSPSAEDRPRSIESMALDAGRMFFEQIAQATANWTEQAMKFTGKGSELPFPFGASSSLAGAQLDMLSPERLEAMRDAGLYLRDLREVAGLTRDELGESLDLSDKNLLAAVESGTATLSFELILRLSALVARHDPLPFVLRMTRSYNPQMWKYLEAWGLTRIPLQYEREREFINIYRSHDEARQLSDDGFRRVLDFTRTAFEMALHFVAEQEDIKPAEERGGPSEPAQ